MDDRRFVSLYPAEAREKEIEKTVSYIKEGNSCQLVGIPGVGRSILLELLPFNTQVREAHFGENQKWVHFVLVNFSEMRGRSLLDVTKFLFLSLLDSLQDRKKMEEHAQVGAIFRESLSYNDELVLFQGLKSAIDYLALEKEFTIVFLFDRFEEYVPVLTSEFFVNLRVLRNRAKLRFSVVFSLTRPLEDLIEPVVFAEFHEFLAGNTVYMQLLDLPSTEFRLRYLENAVKRVELEKRDIDRILTLTGGHGKLTKLAAEITLQDEKHDDSQDFFTADHFLQHQRIIGACYEIWLSLTPSEQDALRMIFSGKDEEDTSYLQRVGLLKEKKLTIQILESFISQFGQAVAKSEDIHFDSETNTIKQAERIISDLLTASEFTLLRYLISQSGKVLERNEVIDAVWKDATSTAGVTDQALDQLISRLRKKIEVDPNHPTHIETIKGRGFKFIP